MTTLSQWHDSGEYFKYQSFNIFYRVQGQIDKPCLLLIHGFPTCSWDWEKISEDLAQHYYLVTLDMLGFGYSDKPKQSYSILQQADIFQTLLKKLNIKQFHVLAHDYGDTVAQELLARSDDEHSVLSVVFSNGGLFPETHHPVFIQKLLLSPIGFLIAKLTTYAKFKKNFDHICAKPLLKEELTGYWKMLEHKGGLKIMHQLIGYMKERKIYRDRWVGAMQKTTVPIHLVNGTLDPISGEHMAKRYQEIIPNPSISRLEDTGHYPQVESPDAFYGACYSFWQKISILD